MDEGEQRRADPGDEREDLARSLGPFDATMIVMGCIIGAGIFHAPSVVAGQMGSAGGVLALWVAGGLIALTGAFVFAELGALLPRAGGQYVFLREAFGRPVAFLFGWTLLASIVSPAIAYVARVFTDHVATLVRPLAPAVAAHAWFETAAPVAVIVFLTLLNVRGVRLGATVQNVAMVAKIAGLLVVIGLGLWAGLVDATPVAPPAASGHPESHGGLWSAIGASLVAVAFSCGGYQNIASVASEMREPRRHVPFAICLGTVGVVVLYLTLNIALIAALGTEGMANTNTPVATAAGAVVAVGEPLVAALVVLSTFAIIQVLLMVTPRIYYAMARDGVFFRSVARVHPVYRTPALAIGLQGGFALLHLWQGEHLNLLQLTEIADVSFLGMCGVALFVLRRKRAHEERAYSVWGYPFTPLVYVLFCVAVVVGALGTAESAALIRAAVLFGVGALLYLVWSRRREPDPDREKERASAHDAAAPWASADDAQPGWSTADEPDSP